MMGIPEEDHQRIFHWTNVILGFGDPDLATDFGEFLQVSMDIGAYASALAEDRRSNHHDDLTTSLVEAEVDGERLTSAEIASFFILLVVAGNETTRNAISHGVLALSRYPAERDKWWSNFDQLTPTAVEEIVRWASPVIYMRRTLTRDFKLSGTKMKSGDKVTLWYNSANRDESTFDNPWLFDVAHPNPHFGFGGGARISAWAPTWPVAKSGWSSTNCDARSPTSSRRTSPRGCCRSSSTASRPCRLPGLPRGRSPLIARSWAYADHVTIPAFPPPEVLAARQKLVLDHFHDEVRQAWDDVLATFPHPRYELIPKCSCTTATRRCAATTPRPARRFPTRITKSSRCGTAPTR